MSFANCFLAFALAVNCDLITLSNLSLVLVSISVRDLVFDFYVIRSVFIDNEALFAYKIERFDVLKLLT